MGRLFLLARRQSRAFAVVELLGLLLCVLGGLILPNLAATSPARAEIVAEEDNSSTEQAILSDGSVRTIKFNINAGTFPQGDNPSDSQPVGADY